MDAYHALAESEKKYRDLFNFMPIALWQLDSRTMRGMFVELRAAGVDDVGAYMTEHPEFLDEAQRSLKITEANERTLHLFGATDREELLKVMPALWLRQSEDWAAADQARRSGSKYYSRESTIRRVDDSIRDVLFSVAFANPDDPESLNTVGAIDITEEKRAKEMLELSERKYRTLFQYMPIAKVQIDVRELLADFARLRSEGVEDLEAYIDAKPEFLRHAMQVIQVVEANDYCCELFGARDSAELSGPVDRFFKVQPDTLTRSLAARFSGVERFMEETQLSTLDGRVLDLLYTSAFSPELSELGIGLVGMIEIADRLNTERRLQQIQAEFAHAARVATLGELAASIAHEVNQPLTAISVNGQASLRWLDHDPPDIGEAQTLAGRIVADARRAGDIVARIRDMAAHKDPRRDPVDLGAVVSETVEFLHRELQVHQIKLDLQLPDNLPAALGDRTQLQQLVLNLAMNAAQALREQAPDRRRLIIRAAQDGDRVRVEVEDSGPGIAEADRARLFSAFFTTKADGLGLGLSICRSIVDYHGGEIRYEPLAIGTRFTFSVPVAGQQARAGGPDELVLS
jgi:signal transduction histidine kinase